MSPRKKIERSSALGKYLDEAGNLPQDVLLGTLVLYTISDGEYSLADLTEQWEDLGLPSGYLPVAAKPIDAYRKATSEVNDFEYPLANDNVAHILVRDVRSDSEVIVRHLTREVRDSQAQKLAYAKIGTATFYRATLDSRGRAKPGSERFKLHIDRDALQPEEREAMQTLVDEVDRRYTRYVNYLDGQKIRSMVRSVLLHADALNVKPSVYFVHISRTEIIEKLKTVVDSLGESSMHHLPIVDLPSQRAMVVEAFQQEAVQALQDLVKEIQRVRESRKTITGDAYAKLKAQYDATLKRTREYSTLLGSVRSKTEGAEEIAQEALKRLQLEMTS